MLQRLHWWISRNLGGIDYQYIKSEFGRRTIVFGFYITFLVVVPFLNSVHRALERSGVLKTSDWLLRSKVLTTGERANLFTAALVSFLFTNAAAMLIFSLVMYRSWFFFFVLQMAFFLLLLFNMQTIREWLGENGGHRPDTQMSPNISRGNEQRPILYYLQATGYLLFDECKKLSIGIFWFATITLLYVIPIYIT